MGRLNAVLNLILIVAVLAVGLVVWRADHHAREADRTLACLQKAQATATVALLAPSSTVDEEGRLRALQTLGKRIDNC
jgi:hypothetical protein